MSQCLFPLYLAEEDVRLPHAHGEAPPPERRETKGASRVAHGEAAHSRERSGQPSWEINGIYILEVYLQLVRCRDAALVPGARPELRTKGAYRSLMGE